jgi:hypothetical protein
MFDIIGKGKRFVERNKRRIIHTWQTMLAERHYYTSLQSYAFECPGKANILSVRNESTVYAVHDKDIFLHNGGQVPVRIALIRQATCFVYSDIILLNDGRCIYELKEMDCLIPVADFMDEILLKDTRNWCKLKSCKKTEHIKSAIKIGGMFGFNYYHFIFQILPKLYETKLIDSSIPLLIDYSARDIASMKQLVEWCNTEHRKIIYMEYDVAYNIDELYTITSPNICVPNWKSKNVKSDAIQCAYSLDSIKTMSNALTPYSSNQKSYEKVFICRGRASKRRRYNEQELLDLAQKYGFEPIYPEELPIEEQINIYHRAKVIIAAGGAALCNLIYCQPDCKLIILCGSHLATSLFSSLILMKGGKVIELYNDGKSKGYQGDFYINLLEFENAIKLVS